MNRDMHALSNAIRQQAQAAMGEYSFPQLGTVSSYDPNTHNVKIIMQPSGNESGWMPLGAIGVGNGWGVAVAPQIGDQVLAVFPHGDMSSGIIVARLFSVQQAAPPIPTGEIWALHSTGSFVKLVTDGDVDVNAAGNCNVTAATSINATAPVINIGSSGETLQQLVTAAMVAFFNSHTHPSNGAPPSQTMGSAQLTTALKGG